MINRARLAILTGAVLMAGSVVQAQSGAHSIAPANAERDKQEQQAVPDGAPAAAAPSGQTEGSAVSLTTGTTLYAVLGTSLDSKKAKAGDAVVAHVTDAVKDDGKVVIPKGAKLVGQVTRSTARGKGDPDSALAIKFDKAVLKNGQEIPISVWIRAMAVEQRSAPQASADTGILAGTGSAAEAGSPMKPTHTTVTGVNDAAGNGPTRTVGGDEGLNAGGQLTPKSRGVFGMDGVQLSTDFSKVEQGSVITSSGKNVRVDGGTKLLLMSYGGAAGAPNK